MSQTSPVQAEFDAEIQAVADMLLGAADDLGSPLGDLVRSQIKRAQPMIRGALVLTVAGPQEDGSTVSRDAATRREQRILLAAALEMLYVALNVHRLLVNATADRTGSDEPLDRSFVGSTILAGDYCFSRAAQMAARTDHPRVVALFSQALQNVSEGLLRTQFSGPRNDARADFDETRELLRSGAEAAGALVELADDATQDAVAYGQELAARWSGYAPDAAGSRPLPQHGRWLYLQQWLLGQRANGKVNLPPDRTRLN